MNAGEFSRRKARIEQEAWRRGKGYAGKAMASLLRESRALPVNNNGKQVGWKLPNGQVVCRKRRFGTEADAMLALATAELCHRTQKIPTRHYLCPHCDGWHLTSQQQVVYQ